MSINNSILLTLNLKDKNIIFPENFVNEEEIKRNLLLPLQKLALNVQYQIMLREAYSYMQKNLCLKLL